MISDRPLSPREEVGKAVHQIMVPPPDRIGDRPWEACGDEWRERCMAIGDVAAAAARQVDLDCALFVLHNHSDDTVLMEWRDEPRRWVFPGGKIKPGELPMAAAIREAREEVGIAILRAVRLEIPPTRGFAGHPMHVFRVLEWAGLPSALIGQQLQWRPRLSAATDEAPYVRNIALALPAPEPERDYDRTCPVCKAPPEQFCSPARHTDGRAG